MTSAPAPRPIGEFSALGSKAIRRDVLRIKQPAILRGLVGDWPAVTQGLASSGARELLVA